MKKFLFIFATLFFVACEKTPEITEKKDTPVSSVTINQDDIVLFIAESTQLTVVVLPENASDKSVIWTSSKEAVATVSKSGFVTAVSEGSATITAMVGGKSAACKITVNKRVVEVTSVELNKNSIELIEGETESLEAKIKPDDADDKTVSWISSDPTVAEVKNGLISALAEGDAVITAKAGNAEAHCTVKVTKKIIHVESIEVNIESKRLKVGESFELQVIITPETANDYTLSYSSTNDVVARVSENGLITGLNKGETRIIITAEDKKREVQVKVFEQDQIYAMAVDWSNSSCIGKIWENTSTILDASGVNLQSFYFINNKMWVVGDKDKVSYPYEFYYIVDGEYHTVNTGASANRNIVISSARHGDDIYSLVEWVYDHYDSKRAIWKNETKLYDLGEETMMSKYSYCAFSKIFFYDNDMYMCGEIMEPVNESSRASFATLWKNGSIYKQFDVRGSDATWGGSIIDVQVINGKFYYLIVRSNGSAGNIIAVYDDSGKLYDLCSEAFSSNGTLHSYNGKLYAAITSNYNESPYDRLSVFEDGNLLYTIPNAAHSVIDIIDGDIYSLCNISRRWGGDYYQSLSVFRGPKLEYTIVEEGEGAFSPRQITVFESK